MRLITLNMNSYGGKAARSMFHLLNRELAESVIQQLEEDHHA